MCQESCCGGPWGGWVWMNGLCTSSRACTTVPRAMCGSVVSTVRSLAWGLECIRALSLAQCSSSWCWKHYCTSSTLIYHGSFSMLMTWCSLWTPRRNVSPDSRHWRLAWNIKDSTAVWRRPSSWSSVLALMFYKNQAGIPVLSAARVLATTPSSARIASCGSTRSAASGITGWLVADENYTCSWCNGESWPIDGIPMTQVDVSGANLDVENTICYLGDMLCSGGGCDSDIAARCCVAWGQFRKLLPFLTSRHLSHKVCVKVYTACVYLAMLHGRKTWGPNISDLEWLRRNDRAMICWICGTKDQDETPSASLLQELGIIYKDIMACSL